MKVIGRKDQESSFSGTLRMFKEVYCNENRLICDLISREFRDLILDPVLDVGAGLGDISNKALPDLDVLLLDVRQFLPPRNPRHKRIVSNFFDYADDSAKTLLLSHVLQYIDNDQDLLRQHIRRLNPRRVLVIENKNTGKFGELMRWSVGAVAGSNPELSVELFESDEAHLLKEASFSATLECPTFQIMAEHLVEILLDAPQSEHSFEQVRQKLCEILPSPMIKIDQKVSCYERA